MHGLARGFLVLSLGAAVLAGASGCDAPEEQKEWGAREGGLSLPAKPGSDREAEMARLEAAAAAAAATAGANAPAVQPADGEKFEEREGGLNLSKKKAAEAEKR